MMKRWLAFVCIIPLIGLASKSVPSIDAVNDYCEANGLILPDSGLQYITANEITDPVQKEIRAKYQKNLSLMSTGDYIEEPSSDAQSLLAMRNKSNLDKAGLVKDLSNLKLAFPFQGLSFIKNEDVIGYTGYTGWDNGWLGISEFFTSEELGVCNFTRYNMKLSHGGVKLVENEMDFLINNKPTDHSVRGNDATGFLYDVTWYDPTYIQGLQCALERFDPEAMDRMISLAIQIDNASF
jgi:hypothetical protein